MPFCGMTFPPVVHRSAWWMNRAVRSEWVNRFLDVAMLARISQLLSLLLLCRHAVAPFRSLVKSVRPGRRYRCSFQAAQFTESTLVDFVREQLDKQPKLSPENINSRAFHAAPPVPLLLPSGDAACALFDPAPIGIAVRHSAMAVGRVPVAPADLKLKVPQRVISPLSRRTGTRVSGAVSVPRAIWPWWR